MPIRSGVKDLYSHYWKFYVHLFEFDKHLSIERISTFSSQKNFRLFKAKNVAEIYNFGYMSKNPFFA